MTFGVPAPSALAGKSLGEAALIWAGLGWSVFPIVPRGKTPYATGEFCGRSDDHSCGFHCATTDQDQLARWWTDHQNSNIGLSAPDAFIVDEDRIGALTGGDVHLPKCPWAITGREEGGRHFFMRAPKGWEGLGGDEVKVTYRVPGVEVKGFDKGYVVAAPSVHASGARYELKAGGHVPEAPAAVIAALVNVERSAILVGAAQPFVTIGPGYQLPEDPGIGGRYDAIRDYAAHLYNRGLSIEEMWPLVQAVILPIFKIAPLSLADARERFERSTKDMPKNLGAPRSVAGVTAPAPPPLSLLDTPLTEFDSRPVEWLWPSWLPKGVVTLMDGNPGVSKSTLVADLIARMTTGRDWPDGTPGTGTPLRAMWITTEDDPGRVLRPRIEAAGGDSSLVRFVTSEVVFPQAASAFLELLVERANEPLGLAFVILDPLFSHIDAKVKSIADADMRQGVMNPLNRAAEAADLSILVVRHFNKDTAASALNRGAGSLGGIVGAARSVWSATVDTEDESGETKAIGVSKLNYARTPPALRYTVVDRVPPGWVTGSVSGIEWLGAAPVSITTMMAETSGVGDAVAALGEILAKGPVGASEVKNLMRSRGFGRDAMNSAASRLRVIKRKPGFGSGWEWALPEEAEHTEGTEGAGENSAAEPSKERASEPSAPSAPSTKDTGLSRATIDTSSVSFEEAEEAEGVPSGGPPARVTPARVREAEAPVLRIVGADDAAPELVCHFYADHRSAHRLVDEQWVCDICSPAATGTAS